MVRTGETVVYDSIDADTIAAGLPDDVPRDLVERLAPTSTVIVPLVGRGAVVGTLTLTRRGGRYDDEDRRFAEELGRHVGLAVANANLFERERAVAQRPAAEPAAPDACPRSTAWRSPPATSPAAPG